MNKVFDEKKPQLIPISNNLYEIFYAAPNRFLLLTITNIYLFFSK